jgi:hypothetical protein
MLFASIDKANRWSQSPASSACANGFPASARQKSAKIELGSEKLAAARLNIAGAGSIIIIELT